MQLFFFEGELAYAVTVSGACRIIFKAVEGLQFMTRAELFFLYTVSPPCGLSCQHFHQEGKIQPLWKVKGFFNRTSRKVRVPDSVFP